MLPINKSVDVSDDLDGASLIEALKEVRDYLRKDPKRTLQFGERRILAVDYAQAMEQLLTVVVGQNDTSQVVRMLREHFDALEVYGSEEPGDIFLTGYFEAELVGSRTPDGRYDYPLLSAPTSLVEVDLPGYKGFALQETTLEKQGRIKILPVPDREAIETKYKSLAKPLAYVDPVDAFFLHIQGSGTVKLKQGGELRVGYAGANSQPYVPIGKFVWDKVPKEQLTMATLESHMRSLSRAEADALMRKNPSYVFFKLRDGEPITSSGVKAFAGRTIATDSSLFPKGSLALLEFDKPSFKSASDAAPSEWARSRRIVLDLDTGGAIKGPARADLFFGRGVLAKQMAGVMKAKARLLYFVPKANWLQQIIAPRPLS